MLAQADVAPTMGSGDGDAPPPAAQPSRVDATGPLPPVNATPANATDPSNASAEPPNPSEYNTAADTDPAALSDFHDSLSPYGDWVDDSTYGTVWVPANVAVGADFTPYVSNGHWGLGVDNSWIWVSDYSWGWAPFHYGRWVWIGGRGWSWIPGRVYSPAWVVWRTGYYDDYYVGWAPMPPTWYWYRGGAVSLWYVPPAPYVFCSSRYVFAPRVRGYIVPAERVAAIGVRTRPYVAATAGVGSSAYRFSTAARGPTMTDAHIPSAAVPSTRASHDARALAFSRAALTSNPPASRSLAGAQPFSRPQANGPLPSAVQPSPFGRAPTHEGFTSRPTVQQPAEMPRAFSPPPAAPRPLAPMPSPQPPTFTPSPAPVAPRSFSPAPFAPSPMPRAYAPPPAPPRSFSPAPAPRSFSPAPAPVFRANPAPGPGRSFGGGRR
jgi:hypothetical protein